MSILGVSIRPWPMSCSHGRDSRARMMNILLPTRAGELIGLFISGIHDVLRRMQGERCRARRAQIPFAPAATRHDEEGGRRESAAANRRRRPSPFSCFSANDAH